MPGWSEKPRDVAGPASLGPGLQVTLKRILVTPTCDDYRDDPPPLAEVLEGER